MKTKVLFLSLAISLLILFLASVSALTIKSVEVSPDEVAPGENAEIVMSIENNLNEDVEDVSVSLDFSDSELPFAPFDSSNEVSIDEIREDRSKRINFKVIGLTGAKSGIYKIPVEIIYFDEDGNKSSKSSVISITINSKPVLDVEVEDGLILKGQNNEVVLKIINKGLSDVKFSEVEFGSSAYATLVSQKKVYFGNIDSDDSETAEFKIFFKENSPSSLNIPVTMHYKDVTNKEYHENFNLNLKVYSKERALQLGLIKQSNTPLIVGGIIILAVVWFIYRKIKKRRRKAKALVK